jgi:TolB-like protein/DNA-binding CsgD family transcriptional regulator
VPSPAERKLPPSPAALGLSERQAEVLALMMQGKSNKAICRVLDLAEPTVKYHVATILKALKVANRTEAVLAVGKLGWKLPPVDASQRDGDIGEPPATAKAREPVAPAFPDKPSIVVLPFANLSGDSSQDYFADGMVEDITIALGHLPSLFVIGSASAFTYKNRTVDLRQIGSELGVRYVLMGSVRKEGNRVRIAVQLTDTSHGHQVWADRFEGELDSVFEMQDRVASQVSSTIAPALRKEEIERARHKPTENLTAHDLFLRALPLYRDSAAHNQEALQLLRQAVELDPCYGAAYGLAAVCYFWQKARGWISPFDASLMEGVRFARLAAQTGANDSEALWMAAQALATLAGELDEASGLIAKALALNPNSSNAWAVSAIIHGYLGDLQTSLDHFERTHRLNPLEFPFVAHWAAISHTHFVAGNFEEVIRCADRALADNPHAFPAMRQKVAACGLLGRVEEGRECAARLRAAVPATTVASLKAHYEPMMRHTPGLIEKFVTGLRRAGLPEK